jgi:hypothetical protein
MDLPNKGRVARHIKINELQKGMVIETGILNAQGRLIIPKGYEVNDDTAAERLKKYLFNQDGSDTIRVLMSVPDE